GTAGRLGFPAHRALAVDQHAVDPVRAALGPRHLRVHPRLRVLPVLGPDVPRRDTARLTAGERCAGTQVAAAATQLQKLNRRNASGPLMLMAKAPGKVPPLRVSEVRIEE